MSRSLGTPGADGAALTIRPPRKPWWRLTVWLIPAVLLSLVNATTEISEDHTAAIRIVGFVLVPIVTVHLLWRNFYAHSSLAADASSITRSGYFGRRRAVPRASVHRVVRVTVSYTRISSERGRWLLFLNEDGRTLLRAPVDEYADEDLARLQDVLAIPWREDRSQRTAAQARTDYPGSIPWPLAHIWITTLAVFSIAVVVISGVTVAL